MPPVPMPASAASDSIAAAPVVPAARSTESTRPGSDAARAPADAALSTDEIVPSGGGDGTWPAEAPSPPGQGPGAAARPTEAALAGAASFDLDAIRGVTAGPLEEEVSDAPARASARRGATEDGSDLWSPEGAGEGAVSVPAAAADEGATATVAEARADLVIPPQPPFVAVDRDSWRVNLPSALLRTVTIGVEPDALTLAGQRVPFDQIEQVRFKVEVGDAILRRAASARMTVHLITADGSSTRVAARNAASARRAEAIVRIFDHLWHLLGAAAGDRRRADLVRRISRGGEVRVGALRLTAIGIAWKRNVIVPWSGVADPEVGDLSVVVPAEGAPMTVAMADDDAYLLPRLIPTLRQRHA